MSRDRRIAIEYTVDGKFRAYVDPSDFCGMTAEKIESEIADQIKEDAAANLFFHASDSAKAVKDIQEAVAEIEAREESEDAAADEAYNQARLYYEPSASE